MSVKEYFAHPTIKTKVIEFLKAKGDFEYLHKKHKRPFRAYITADNDKEFYVSDDYHQIKCSFSPDCVARFNERYPESMTVHKVANMLVCLQEYKLVLRDSQQSSVSMLRLGSKVEVLMQIEDLQVISFD